MFAYAVTALVAYLLGSVPTGFLVGKTRGVDLRKEGSGNIGATNALRVLGKKFGYFVFAADALKGIAAVWAGFLVARSAGLAEHGVILAGITGAICVLLGNNFPVWLGFKGGKGIATSAGVAIALFPIWVFLVSITTWVVLFFTTRFVSVASIGAALALGTTGFVLFGLGQCDLLRAVIGGLMTALALWRHKPNIERLLAGTEKRFTKRSAS